METFLQILFIVGICLAGLFCWMPVVRDVRKGEPFATALFKDRDLVIASNVVPGTVASHPGVVTRLLEADLTARKLLVRQGTDDDEVLVGTTAKPLGVVDDTGEIGDRIAVQLLGSAQGTLVATASEEIDAGEDLYAAAGGKVSTLPVAAGTYYFVGVALTSAGADDDEIEFDPSSPRAVVVS